MREVTRASKIDLADAGHTRMMHTPFVILLAFHIHESGCAPVKAGETLAHAVQSPQVRPFVEWPDLPPEVVVGRTMTAARLLAAFEVVHHAPDAAYDDINDEMVSELAAAIHEAERAAVDGGYVLVKLNRPWVPYGDLPEQAQAGRKRQAFYLLQRYRFNPITAV